MKLRDIYDFIRYDIRYGIENLIRWFPVIWRDRDYDSDYIFALLEKKLGHVADATEQCQHFVGWEDDVRRQRRCIELIQRIRAETNFDELHSEHDAKWGELSMREEPLEKPYHCPAAGDMVVASLMFSRPNAVTPEQKAEEHKDSMTMYDEIDRRNKAEREELFSILRDHIMGWWD